MQRVRRRFARLFNLLRWVNSLVTPFFNGRRAVRLFVLAALVAPMLAACGGGVGSSGVKRAAFSSKEFGVSVSPRVTRAKYPPRGGGRSLPLKPYRVAGKTYSPVAGPGYVERGRASWYGQDFHGRRTANGEIFGAFYLTAASPVLPIPSYARVTNLENGRSVLVRVNDRGPYLQGRIIDLSYQAASILGYVNKGSADVEVRYVAPAPLNGDDNKMLMASVNRLTPFEASSFDASPDVRLAMVEEPAATNLLAGDEIAVVDGRIQSAGYQPSRGSYSGEDFVNDVFGLFSYAGEDQVTAAHAAANAMATRDTGLQQWASTVDEDARSIRLQVGVFRDPEKAAAVAQSFALLAAADEQTVDAGGQKATVVTLVKLKPGVERADVLAMARELGLDDLVLY